MMLSIRRLPLPFVFYCNYPIASIFRFGEHALEWKCYSNKMDIASGTRIPPMGFHPIHFTRSVKYSRLARSFSPSFRHSLETTQSTLQNHDYGISVDDMKRHPFYRVVATSLDELGKEYVAIIESKNYPIYGVQFHPESSNEPFLDFFHSELKKNSHRCDSLPPVHMTAQKNHYVF